MKELVPANWSADVLADGSIPFPRTLLRALRKIFPDTDELRELSVLLSIVDFTSCQPDRKPSVEDLAVLAGMPTSHFRPAMKRLAKQGFISVQEDEGGLEISLEGFQEAITRKISRMRTVS